jgi:hypothetical protein
MRKSGLVAMLICLAAGSAQAGESLAVSVVGAGEAGPQKICEIGREGSGFWALEQITTNSFPAPKVSLDPFEGREERFAALVAILNGTPADLSGWQQDEPDAPYVQLTLVQDSASGEARRTLYLPGLGVPPDVEGLFGELRRYGMDCLPPVLR